MNTTSLYFFLFFMLLELATPLPIVAAATSSTQTIVTKNESSSSSTSTPKIRLQDLPTGILQKTREILIGPQWTHYKEFHTIPVPTKFVPQLCAGIRPLQSIFTKRIDKTRTTHPTYGTLSISTSAQGTPSLQLTCNKVTQDIQLPSSLERIKHAYFFKEYIVLEAWLSTSHTYTDAVTLFIKSNAVPNTSYFAITDIQPHVTASQENCYMRITPGVIMQNNYMNSFFDNSGILPLKGEDQISGFLTQCSEDERFIITTRNSLLDMQTRNNIYVDFTKNYGVPIGVYDSPHNTSTLLIQTPEYLIFFNTEEQRNVAYLQLSSHCRFFECTDQSFLKAQAPKPLQNRHDILVVAHVDDNNTITDYHLAMPLQFPSLMGLCLDGTLTSYTPGAGFIAAVQACVGCKPGKFTEGFILPSPAWNAIVQTTLQKRFPFLAAHYKACVAYKDHQIKNALPAFSPEFTQALEDVITVKVRYDKLYAEGKNDTDLQNLYANCVSLFIGSLVGYYRNHKDAFTTMWDIKKDIKERLPRMQEIESCLNNNKDNKWLLTLIKNEVQLPDRVIAWETIAADMQELITTKDAVLEELIKNWFVHVCTERAQTAQPVITTMQELIQTMTDIPSINELPERIWNDWIYALQEATALPWEAVTVVPAPAMQVPTSSSASHATDPAISSDGVHPIPEVITTSALPTSISTSAIADTHALQSVHSTSLPTTLMGSLYRHRRTLGTLGAAGALIWGLYNKERIMRVLQRLCP